LVEIKLKIWYNLYMHEFSAIPQPFGEGMPNGLPSIDGGQQIGDDSFISETTTPVFPVETGDTAYITEPTSWTSGAIEISEPDREIRGAASELEAASDEPTRSFDEFTAGHTTEILSNMDGEEGFFGRAQREGTPDVDPRIAEIIDDIDDSVLARLNVTKGDLKAIAQTFGAGQERARITHIAVPSEVSVEGDRVHTDLGDFDLSRSLDPDAPVLPRGNFSKSTGGLWLMAPTLEERYPDPEQRRIATLWTAGHELTHGIIGQRVFQGVLAPPEAPAQDIATNPQGYMGQTTWLQQNFPQQPLTEYSGSYRLPDGSMPSVTEGPIGYVKALEEEMCETTAATLCGFAPTPGRSTDTNLNQPFHDRGTFQKEVWRFIRSAT
jgi:hypothetical protein